VASYFIALVTIYSCFKSTNLAITAGGSIETVEPNINSGLAGFIIISFITYFGYNKFIREENDVN
jgi:hypothetical protein